MIPLFILSCLSAFFRSRYNLALEILALHQQLGVLISGENSLTLGCESKIEYFGFCSAAFGLRGVRSSSLSNQRPWSPGIAQALGLFWRLRSQAKSLTGQRSMLTFDL
jgi:hypothetical protein